jgi:hypothetical protein
MRPVCILAFVIVPLNSLRAQQAVVTKTTANLRADPTTAEPPEAALHRGDKITLLDPTPEHGYYQVETQDGKQGWVSLRAVRVLASPSSSDPAADPEALTTDSKSGCDDTLWNHVYHSHRLIVKQQCVTVTGTIVDATSGKERDGLRHEEDGDTHGWLKVDPQFENLLNAGNIKDEGGNLVFEIVCKFPVTQSDAIAVCANYSSPIRVPPVGSRVQIIGTYVRDTNHAHWMEIHPVSSISVIQ